MKAVFGPYIVNLHKSLAHSKWLAGVSYRKQGYVANHTLSGADVVIDIELYGSVVGTVLVRIDSENGLFADESHSFELDAMRAEGRKLAELCRFAIMPGQPTRAIMGAMFHCVYYYTRMLNDVTDLICEVVPHHIAGQKRLLGFVQVGESKPCKRVGVQEAVLLHRELS